MVTRKAVAVIPARGGSKRVPRKNILDFRGKPLIAWTIEAAVESGLFDRVLVSTDDIEIARVARDCGVEVPFMREDFADDHSPVSLAVVDALEQLSGRLGENYETVAMLMANCPLRGSDDMIDAFDNFNTSPSDFQLSCFKFGWMNPSWAVKLDSDGRPEAVFPQAREKRSQDLDEYYCPTGAIWIANCEALLESRNFYGPGHIFHPMDWKAAVDIDTYEDLDFAGALFDMQVKREYCV